MDWVLFQLRTWKLFKNFILRFLLKVLKLLKCYGTMKFESRIEIFVTVVSAKLIFAYLVNGVKHTNSKIEWSKTLAVYDWQLGGPK